MDLTPGPTQDQERSEALLTCPECAPGAARPHREPDKPHIHLTAYGYLLYAPKHEQLDFVREIRELERRAGREEAARDIEEWAEGYESFARGESNTEVAVMNLRHAGRIAREGQAAPWIGRDRHDADAPEGGSDG